MEYKTLILSAIIEKHANERGMKQYHFAARGSAPRSLRNRRGWVASSVTLHCPGGLLTDPLQPVANAPLCSNPLFAK